MPRPNRLFLLKQTRTIRLCVGKRAPNRIARHQSAIRPLQSARRRRIMTLHAACTTKGREARGRARTDDAGHGSTSRSSLSENGDSTDSHAATTQPRRVVLRLQARSSRRDSNTQPTPHPRRVPCRARRGQRIQAQGQSQGQAPGRPHATDGRAQWAIGPRQRIAACAGGHVTWRLAGWRLGLGNGPAG